MGVLTQKDTMLFLPDAISALRLFTAFTHVHFNVIDEYLGTQDSYWWLLLGDCFVFPIIKQDSTYYVIKTQVCPDTENLRSTEFYIKIWLDYEVDRLGFLDGWQQIDSYGVPALSCDVLMHLPNNQVWGYEAGAVVDYATAVCMEGCDA